jgi:hypothetical protein
VGFAFQEKQAELAVDEKTLERVSLDSDGVAAIFKELESTVRSQVTDTFSAIFA